MPYIRVDEELKKVVKRLQGFFRLAEGKVLSEGQTIKEVLKESVFEITGPDKKKEIIHYPFDQFEVKHRKRRGS